MPLKRSSIRAALKHLGFSDYETSVYLALAMLGESPVKHIAEKSGISSSKIYDVLQRLEQKHYIHCTPGRPVKYTVLPVSQMLQPQLQEVTDTIQQGIHDLNTLYAQAITDQRFETDFWVLQSDRQSLQHLSEGINNLRYTLRIHWNHPFPPHLLDQIADIPDDTGHSIHGLINPEVHQSTSYPPDFLKHAKLYTWPTTASFLVIDNQAAYSLLSDPGQNYRVLVTWNPALISIFRDYFDLLWESATHETT